MTRDLSSRLFERTSSVEEPCLLVCCRLEPWSTATVPLNNYILDSGWFGEAMIIIGFVSDGLEINNDDWRIEVPL